MRMVTNRLSNNQHIITTDYSRVTLGGVVKDNSRLVLELSAQVEALTGLCWSQISLACSERTQLDVDQWLAIGQTPPDWLRDVFEAATLLTAMPDEPSLANLHESQRVLVLRDATLGATSGLLPQAGALLPKGFTTDDAQIWWPWVMGSKTAVILVATKHPFVLQEVSLTTLLEDAE